MKFVLKTIILALFYIGISIEINGQIISTVAGGGSGGEGVLATAAEIGYAAGLIVDKHGNIYISTGLHHRIRKVNVATGTINTIVGTGSAGYNGDGIAATAAQINGPACISFDANENLYFYDAWNNRIRKVDAITGIISTYAGNGSFGVTGDGGPATAASIDGGDMAWDAAGNLYYTSIRKIRKISPSGIISTYAGNGLPGITGEGVPATATFLAPMRGLAFDGGGNLYCVDSTASVRKILASTGLIHRVAGTGDNITSPYSGDGIAATSCHIGPFDISVDDSGNIYLPDFTNSRVEKVDKFGIIRTVAGTGVSGFSGDGGLAVSARIYAPENVALDNCNNIYIADFNNKRIRKVTFNPLCNLTDVFSIKILNNFHVYPNPANEEVHLENTPSNARYQLCNFLGSVMQYGTLKEGDNVIIVKHLAAGLYMLLLTDEEGKRTVHKLVKE